MDVIRRSRRSRRAAAAEQIAEMVRDPRLSFKERVTINAMAQDIEAVRRDPVRTGAAKDRAIKAILRRR